MGHKAVEKTCKIKNAFGPGTANEHIVQWWFKKFYKGDYSLENEEHSDWPSEVDNDQVRGSTKLILLQLTGQVAQELSVDYCMVTWHLKQIGKV